MSPETEQSQDEVKLHSAEEAEKLLVQTASVLPNTSYEISHKSAGFISHVRTCLDYLAQCEASYWLRGQNVTCISAPQ